jgi:aspartyl-tRNA(Asn)/glutamyl-tRNA(Gln) amidotransferase subunit A
MESRAGSKVLEGYKPPFDATSVAKIKAEGGAIIGKTNQDEFGFGTFSTNSGYGVPKNPFDTERSCGGSSGGAAGLAAGLDMPHIALAESTGGSISCPAAFCGVVGLTPTYGAVSRWGMIDYGSSLDKIGPIGKNVEDVSLAFDIIRGKDPLDPTSIEAKDEKVPKKFKIGVPKEYFEGVDDNIQKLVWTRIKQLESEGHKYKEISLPMTKHALSAYYVIACSEASSNLAKFCGMRYGASEEVLGPMDEYFSLVRTKYLGKEAKRRILLGTFARMAGYRDQYYLKALQVRTKIIEEFSKAFKQFDVLVAPTMPVVAPKFSEIEKLTPVQQYAMDVLTVGPNLAGIPQLTLPAGKEKRVPVGVHMLGPHTGEKKLLQLGSFLD